MKSHKQLVSLGIIFVATLAGSTAMLGQASPDVEQGTKPYGSYHGGAIDQVSLTNGNLTLQAEMLSYSQRGDELAYPVVIRYNNKVFSRYQAPCPHRGGLQVVGDVLRDGKGVAALQLVVGCRGHAEAWGGQDT